MLRFLFNSPLLPWIGRMSLARSLTLLIVLVCTVLVVSTALLGWNARRQWLENDRKAMENLAYSLAQHADATFSQTDMVVLDIAERIRDAWPAETARAQLRNVRLQKVAQQEHLSSLRVLDAAEIEIATSSSVPESARQAGHDAFLHHYLSRYPNGTVTQVSPLDGVDRQYAYRRLAGYPLVVLAAAPVIDLLAG